MTERDAAVRFDGWTLRREPLELLRDGKPLKLQEQPLQILDELLAQPNVLIPRDRLIARLWPDGVVEFDGSLNTAVRKLRSVLGDDADAPRYIETVPRQGYRFIGAVEAPVTSMAPAPRPTRRQWIALAFAAAVVAVAIGFVSLREQTPAPAGHPRIAVLPFQNLSPHAEDEYFTDGLHGEIVATLAERIPELEVISRTTMMTYRATPKSVSTIARELGVTHVLEGSVLREGRSVRLSLQLIDARNDSQAWSRIYQRELTSAMSLQTAVAQEVGAQLAVKLAAGQAPLPSSRNSRAYDLYLKARLAAQPFGGRASLPRLIEVEHWLDDAIALDPAFAAAYLDRGRIRLRKFENSYDVSPENLAAIRADFQRVRALAGSVPLLLSAEAGYALGVEQDLPAALRLVELPAVRASHDVTVLVQRAGILANARRLDEALALYQQAADLDPRNPGLIERWQALLWNARRPAEALNVLTRINGNQPPRVSFEFAFTGRTSQMDESANPISNDIDPGIQLMARSNRLRLRGLLAESYGVLDRTSLRVIRQDSFSPVSIPAIGHKPVAELHGWAALLTGDAAGAARDAARIREFLAGEPVTKWNGWFLRFLDAEGDLFAGRRDVAARKAREALALAPRRVDVAIDRYAPALAAMILAWAGDADGATALLEELSRGYPGMGPAEITREPLYATRSRTTRASLP